MASNYHNEKALPLPDVKGEAGADLESGAVSVGGNVSDADSDVLKLDWTAAEERAVVRKLDATVLGLLFFGFFCFQLERGNISNAATSTLFKDVGITQNQFNTGQGLLYLGIVLLEVPSQIMIQRVGPQKWLTFQVLCFGLVATLQLFIHSYGSFLGTRILLGVVECGYIPGSLYTLSTFYKRSELASRTSLFFVGSQLVSGVGGLMASGILTIKGPLKPWQYLFLIEGLIAIFCAILFLLLLPDSPQRPVPFLFPRLTLFNTRQRDIVLARVVVDDAAKAAARRPLTRREVLDTLGNWRNYPHILFAIACIAVTAAQSQYGPLLIKGFGFGTIKANALSSVGGWLGLIILIITGFLADHTTNKGYLVIIMSMCSLVCWIAFQSMSLTNDKWAKYATLTLTTGFSQSWHPINATWLSLNQRTPQQRAIAMAMFIMAANTGAAVGSQILRAEDSPTYHVGFRVCVALMAFGVALAIAQHVQYRLTNRRNARRLAAGEKLREDRVERYIM